MIAGYLLLWWHLHMLKLKTKSGSHQRWPPIISTTRYSCLFVINSPWAWAAFTDCFSETEHSRVIGDDVASVIRIENDSWFCFTFLLRHSWGKQLLRHETWEGTSIKGSKPINNSRSKLGSGSQTTLEPSHEITDEVV